MTQPHSNDQSPSSIDRRAAAISAIHFYADWLAANPDVPAPTSVDGHVFNHFSDYDNPTRDEQIAIGQHLAAKYGGSKNDSGPDKLWVIVRVPGTGDFKVEHTYFVEHPKKMAAEW